ncbi:MAG: sigma 54-interacting transcriptional regulator, partial [Thermoanaerobaculia bacterium]
TEVAIRARTRLRDGERASSTDLRLYEDLVTYVLYEIYREALVGIAESGGGKSRIGFYRDFRRDVADFLDFPDVDRSIADAAPHLFACFFQVRRAFLHIFTSIVGRSLAAAKLRAAVWQSIFTHDMRRYRRVMYSQMADVATLITGPTGTGKELVARAIGLSQYVAFDERTEKFAGEPADAFVSVNLSALSPTLIESELFGHRKGAFTGAVADREGFLESSGAHGTVFLDEIGDVDPSIQVKLLRVIQSRTFQRLGDTATRVFQGKIIAATNRDLQSAMADGRFRDDFYYRLCADSIATPSLVEQLAGEGGELPHLVRFIAGRVAGEAEADDVTREVLAAIEVSPGMSYGWPGNFRELEQCVRSVLVRGSYSTPRAAASIDAEQHLAAAIVEGRFNADDMLRNYCTLLYAKTRNYSQVAERLGIDRRTVKAKIDATLLAKWE